MTDAVVLDLIGEAIRVTMFVAGPMLVTALAVGVLVSLVQAVTQIQEQTLTFVPKLVAMAAVMFFLMPWLMRQIVRYLVDTMQRIPGMIS